MPKGRSYSADPWDSYDKGAQTFAHDDFVHDKTFVFKAKLEKDNDGVNIKESINEKADGLSGSGQVKFWFNLQNQRSFYAKIGSSSNLHLQYDSGIHQVKDFNTNFFSGLEANRTFTERILHVGGEIYKNKEWSLSSRIRYDLAKKTSQVDYKSSWCWKNWKINGYNTLDITNKLLVKSGLLVARSPLQTDKCKCNWFVRFEGAKNPDKLALRQFVQNIIVSCNEQVTDTQKVGIEARLLSKNVLSFLTQPWKGFDAFWLVSEWKWGGTTVKARMNTQLTHAITVKNKLGSYGSYSLGVEGSDLGGKNKCKFGVQLDLNL